MATAQGGIEILTIDARIVIASVDTYLRFAEAVNRLDLEAKSDSKGLPELMEDVTSGGSKTKTKGALEGAKEKVQDVVGGGDDDEEKEEKESQSRKRSSSSRSGSRSRSRSGSGDDE